MFACISKKIVDFPFSICYSQNTASLAIQGQAFSVCFKLLSFYQDNRC